MTVHREQPIDGEKTRRLRTEAWMNQGELSAKSGVAVDTISRIEQGKRLYPRRSTIFALADALGVKPKELLLSDPFPLPGKPPEDEGEGGASGAADSNGHSRRTG